MKVSALNPCRRHVVSILTIGLAFTTIITSCKKDEGVAPETSIGAENLRHHRTWNDTVKNSPGAITVTGSSATTGTTTTGSTGAPVAAKPASGTTTPTTGSTTTTTKPVSGTTPATGTSTTTTGTTTTTAAPAYKASAAITLNGKSNIVISGLAVPSITLNNCTNITIKNCKIGPSSTFGVNTYQCTGVTVDSCLISNVVTGVNAVSTQTIVVSNCQAKNMQGPYPHGQFVQFNNVSGGGNRVLNNKFENVLGQSTPEDAISMYQSSGLANDPILISGNSIRGGGPSHTGGGIMLGDGGGSNIIAENNTLVDPGQYGMAVSGGTNMSIINNSIYAKQQSFTNVGLYYWNQSGKASSGITISGNKVNFTSSSGALNNSWLPSGTLAPSGWSTNTMSQSLTESLLPAVLTSL